MIVCHASDCVVAHQSLCSYSRYVHKTSQPPPLDIQPFETSFIRQYVALARSYEPTIPEDLVDYIVGIYVGMRQEEQRDKKTSTYTSARSLLGLLRLSSALARLRRASSVVQDDVDEAFRLMTVSKASLFDDDQREQR